MKLILRSFLLLFIFILAFFVTTAVFDTIERHTGYYDQGQRDSAMVGKDLFIKWIRS